MELTLADFVLFVIVGSFVLVPVFAIISRTLHRREENRALANRVICRLCLRAFEDIGHTKVVTCSTCGALNERGRSRKLG
jgi:hypothetical protein